VALFICSHVPICEPLLITLFWTWRKGSLLQATDICTKSTWTVSPLTTGSYIGLPDLSCPIRNPCFHFPLRNILLQCNEYDPVNPAFCIGPESVNISVQVFSLALERYNRGIVPQEHTYTSPQHTVYYSLWVVWFRCKLLAMAQGCLEQPGHSRSKVIIQHLSKSPGPQEINSKPDTRGKGERYYQVGLLGFCGWRMGVNHESWLQSINQSINQIHL
jgi:hypothetical protein